MVSVASDAMRRGLRNSAAAIENFIEACAALGPKVGDQVVTEHMDLTLGRLRRLQRDLEARASAPVDADALYVALGVATAGLASLAQAFEQMHVRVRAMLPNRLPPEARYDEDPDEVPI